MFEIGNTVKITKGRKMVGETKTISAIYEYRPPAHDYGNRSGLTLRIEYLRFTDGTKCASHNCELVAQ